MFNAVKIQVKDISDLRDELISLAYEDRLVDLVNRALRGLPGRYNGNSDKVALSIGKTFMYGLDTLKIPLSLKRNYPVQRDLGIAVMRVFVGEVQKLIQT